MPSIFNPFASIICVHCLMNRGTPSLSTTFSRGEPKYLCRSSSWEGREGGREGNMNMCKRDKRWLLAPHYILLTFTVLFFFPLLRPSLFLCSSSSLLFRLTSDFRLRSASRSVFFCSLSRSFCCCLISLSCLGVNTCGKVVISKTTNKHFLLSLPGVVIRVNECECELSV